MAKEGNLIYVRVVMLAFSKAGLCFPQVPLPRLDVHSVWFECLDRLYLSNLFLSSAF
jgi:hypothetical protein